MKTVRQRWCLNRRIRCEIPLHAVIWTEDCGVPTIFGSISGKMSVWLRAENVEMGQEGNANLPIQLRAEIASARLLKNIRLWRDGKWIAQKSLSSRSESVVLQDENASPGKHCYIVRAESEPTVSDLPLVGYSSPIWLNIL